MFNRLEQILSCLRLTLIIVFSFPAQKKRVLSAKVNIAAVFGSLILNLIVVIKLAFTAINDEQKTN